MESERFRMATSFAMAVLALLIWIILSPAMNSTRGIQIVSKDQAILPTEEETVEVVKPKPPPVVEMERPMSRNERPTVVPQTRPPANFTPVNFDHPSSPNPGSSIANVRNIVGAPPGGFRPGDYDIAGNTPDEGAGFTDTWRPPFADTDARPDAVRKQKQVVAITRLAHSLSYPKIYDGSLGQLEKSLNNNNPGMSFSINLQQFFWPSGNILLIIGEDPEVASESGRVEGSLKDSFAGKEEMQLKKYVDSGGILLVMEATPYYSTGGFRTKMEEEVRRVFGDGWKKYPIFFAGRDFIKEFNQSNTYSYLATILTAVLGKKIN